MYSIISYRSFFIIDIFSGNFVTFSFSIRNAHGNIEAAKEMEVCYKKEKNDANCNM